MTSKRNPSLLILNQMGGPMVWQFAQDFASTEGSVALLTGHPDTLAKSHRDIVMTPAAPHSKGNYFLRVWSWLRYCAQAARWISLWPKTTPILVYSTPPVLPWLGWLFAVLRHQPYAVMVHDIYPDLLIRLNGNSTSAPLIRFWQMCNRRTYERAEIVMTLGPHMAEILQRSFNPGQTTHGRIEVVPPWADTNEIQPSPKPDNWFAQKFNQVDKLTVMYSGNMGLSHDIDTLIAAAEELRDEPRIHFMFIGSGLKWNSVSVAIAGRSLPNVTLLAWQPEDVVPHSFAAADVALISLKQELAGILLPSKAYSFMAAGVPLVLSTADNGELADLVERYPLGWRVTPRDAEALAKLLRSVARMDLAPFRAASRHAAEEIGSRENSRLMTNLLCSAFPRPSR